VARHLRSSFDLDAAEEVGGGDLDTLASLVNRSLLRPANGGASSCFTSSASTHANALRRRDAMPSLRTRLAEASSSD
jgi:hypothetical protein